MINSNAAHHLQLLIQTPPATFSRINLILETFCDFATDRGDIYNPHSRTLALSYGREAVEGDVDLWYTCARAREAARRLDDAHGTVVVNSRFHCAKDALTLVLGLGWRLYYDFGEITNREPLKALLMRPWDEEQKLDKAADVQGKIGERSLNQLPAWHKNQTKALQDVVDLLSTWHSLRAMASDMMMYDESHLHGVQELQEGADKTSEYITLLRDMVPAISASPQRSGPPKPFLQRWFGPQPATPSKDAIFRDLDEAQGIVSKVSAQVRWMRDGLEKVYACEDALRMRLEGLLSGDKWVGRARVQSCEGLWMGEDDEGGEGALYVAAPVYALRSLQWVWNNLTELDARVWKMYR